LLPSSSRRSRFGPRPTFCPLNVRAKDAKSEEGKRDKSRLIMDEPQPWQAFGVFA